LLQGILVLLLSALAAAVLPAESGASGIWMSAFALCTSAIASIVVYFIVMRGLKSRPGLFISTVMVGLLVKMGTGIAALVIVGLAMKEQVKLFAICFMIGYLVFTTTEVIFLLAAARKKQA